jgi:regulatory protein
VWQGPPTERRRTRRTRRRRRTRRSRPEPPDPAQAYDTAIRLLGLRSHSVAELGRKLSRRGFDADTVTAVLARLADQGHLDDSQFAQGVVEHRSRNRGSVAIAAELASKGVDRRLVQTAVAGLDPEVEIEAALRLTRAWLPRAEPGSLRSLLQIAGPRLLRRGYGSRVVREACRRALDGDGLAAGDPE